tara:strand:+ start:97 stop:504 length:408 start_codon:yes stop_codon:yes gene_type:complete
MSELPNIKILRKYRVRRYVSIGDYENNLDQEISKRSIVFEKPDKNLSFKKLDTDLTIIENPNILEINKFSNLKNENQPATDKFSDSNDPIYDLDEDKAKIEKTTKLDTTVSKAAKQNLLNKANDINVANKTKTRY